VSTRLVRDAPGHPREGPHRDLGRGAARHPIASCVRASADPRVRAGAAGEPVLQPQALRPGQGRPLQGQPQAGHRAADLARHAHRGRIVATIEYLIRLHAGEEGYELDDIDHFGNRRLRYVGELIQNQIRVGLSVWSAWSASG